jgi:hypothetical protein
VKIEKSEVTEDMMREMELEEMKYALYEGKDGYRRELGVLAKEGVYVGKMSKADSKTQLENMPDGTFLLRDSSIEKHHVFSFVRNSKVEHLLVFAQSISNSTNEHNSITVDSTATKVSSFTAFIDNNRSVLKQTLKEASQETSEKDSASPSSGL